MKVKYGEESNQNHKSGKVALLNTRVAISFNSFAKMRFTCKS